MTQIKQRLGIEDFDRRERAGTSSICNQKRIDTDNANDGGCFISKVVGSNVANLIFSELRQ